MLLHANINETEVGTTIFLYAFIGKFGGLFVIDLIMKLSTLIWLGSLGVHLEVGGWRGGGKTTSPA